MTIEQLAAASGLDRARMIVQQEEPLNAEPVPQALIARHLTPQAIFYVRNHGPVPALAADHAVAIGGRGWDRAALERAFPVRSVMATLQCAGNRRADMQAVAATGGDPWQVGAIGNAVWTGVSLIDVLRAAGLEGHGDHVHFLAADAVTVEGQRAPYGVSIAMDKARDPDVLIAWAMNGELLAPEHGAPLRLIVPGYAGVRSIKWLTDITVADGPSAAPIQARDYKLFPATVRSSAEADWDAGLTIETLPVNAALCSLRDGARIDAGRRRLAQAMPWPMAAAWRAWRFRPMAAQAGCRPISSAASTRAGAGCAGPATSTWRRDPASWSCAPSTMPGRGSPNISIRCGISRAISRRPGTGRM